MSRFILDASVTLPWRFKGVATAWSEALRNRVVRGEEVVPEQRPVVISLEERHGLTIYDASHLELSQRSGLPRATLDRNRRNAAREASVPLIEPMS